MTAEEMKQYKAKQLRYKKPIARDMNLASIREAIWDMGELISDVQWFVEDEENLVNALAGDEDEVRKVLRGHTWDKRHTRKDRRHGILQKTSLTAGNRPTG